VSVTIGSEQLLVISVPGRPVPGGSKKAFAHAKTGRIIVTDDAKGNRDWKARVASFAAHGMDGVPPFTCPIEVEVEFRVERPKGHYGTGGNASSVKPSAPRWPTTRPDATKLWRAVEDACNGIVWKDDSQVVRQHVSKVYCDRPGVRVVVRRVDP